MVTKSFSEGILLLSHRLEKLVGKGTAAIVIFRLKEQTIRDVQQLTRIIFFHVIRQLCIRYIAKWNDRADIRRHVVVRCRL